MILSDSYMMSSPQYEKIKTLNAQKCQIHDSSKETKYI